MHADTHTHTRVRAHTHTPSQLSTKGGAYAQS